MALLTIKLNMFLTSVAKVGKTNPYRGSLCLFLIIFLPERGLRHIVVFLSDQHIIETSCPRYIFFITP